MDVVLGKSVGLSDEIPGTIPRVGTEVIYFSDDGVLDFATQFEMLTRDVWPRRATKGGKLSQRCRLWLPDGSLFHPVRYHGDIEGWRSDIEVGAKQLGISLARIEGETIVVSDGRSFHLAKCKVEFDK